MQNPSDVRKYCESHEKFSISPKNKKKKKQKI